MVYKCLADFETELAELQQKLAAAGRDAIASGAPNEAGIRCDFELPYSTMPRLSSGKRWNDKPSTTGR